MPAHRVVWQAALITPYLLFFSNSSSAQTAPGTVTYGPLSAPIPTLSGYSLIFLAMLMIAAVSFMRRNGRFVGGKFLGIALAVGALASITSGFKIVSDAYAPPQKITVELGNPSGGTEDLFYGTNCVKNITSMAQQITKISINGGTIDNAGSCSTNSGAAPFCYDTPPNNTILNTDDICEITVLLPAPET
jgi:hypothetical protein